MEVSVSPWGPVVVISPGVPAGAPFAIPIPLAPVAPTAVPVLSLAFPVASAGRVGIAVVVTAPGASVGWRPRSSPLTARIPVPVAVSVAPMVIAVAPRLELAC